MSDIALNMSDITYMILAVKSLHLYQKI